MKKENMDKLGPQGKSLPEPRLPTSIRKKRALAKPRLPSDQIFHYFHYIHCIHYFHSNLFNATFRHVSSICARSAKGGDLTTTDQTSAIAVKLLAVMTPLM